MNVTQGARVRLHRAAPRRLLRIALLAAFCPAVLAQTAMPSGAGLVFPGAAAPGAAHEPADEPSQLRAQATFVRQSKPSFRAAYSGPNSLVPQAERSYSFTATAMLGWRTWRGGEVYLNPEVAQGVPLSGLTGLAGSPNGELARTAGPDATLYLARLFVRQTFGFGGGRQPVESDQNQLGGAVDARRLVITAGVLPVIDVFDDNAFSHDARTQFMNWALVTHGAFDFAADARGYSRGVAIEWFDRDWAVRIGRFAQPRVSNGAVLNPALGRSFGDQAEFEVEHSLLGQPGKLRLLAFRNRAAMGSFADALAAAGAGGTPDVGAVRRDATKIGFGINLEQRLGRWGGAFVRASRHDGRTESYAYTEIDRSVSGGVLLDGARWRRAGDSAGIGLARNGLSGPHRAYLAAGGQGFFLGDGRLNYRPETIVEAFYALAIAPRTWLSLNVQRIVNPAYNADRGPVSVAGLRLHANF